MVVIRFLAVAFSLLTVDVVLGQPAEQAGQQVLYGRDIRPLLSDRCFHCHGQDEATRAMGLRLDLREGAIEDLGGYAAVVPGDAEASELWLLITAEDEDERMPPASAGKRPFSAEDLAKIRTWIEQGAPYELHWAFDVPTRPELPAAAKDSWIRNPVDGFVLSRLQTEGIEPAPETDPRTLLRRIFLDVTGLPPTLEELDLFATEFDASGSRAKEDAVVVRWVDKLMTQEPYVTRFAERMATPWLDAARYADTNGIHTDNARQIWHYRDWVIRALRDGMPYDQFITEQLAGDLIPNATQDQFIATGFNRAHVTTDEGGAINEEYLVEYAVDRTDTVGAVFLGLTMGCARCHDHKYDPISAEDYYSLFAYFNSIEEKGLYRQHKDNPDVALVPAMSVETESGKAKRFELEAAVAETEKQVNAPEWAEAFQASYEAVRQARVWIDTAVESASALSGAALLVQEDGSVKAEGDVAAQDAYELILSVPNGQTSASYSMLLLEGLGQAGPKTRAGRAPKGNAVVTGLGVEVVAGDTVSGSADASGGVLRLENVGDWAWASQDQPDEGLRAADLLGPDPQRGWGINGRKKKGDTALVVRLAEPVRLQGDQRVRVRIAFGSELEQHALAKVRVRFGSLARPEILPIALGSYYGVGPFEDSDVDRLYATAYGPEKAESIELDASFGQGALTWKRRKKQAEGKVDSLGTTKSAYYIAREVFAAVPTTVPVSLGSDDGFALFVNGQEVLSKRVNRGPAENQDSAQVSLKAGRNLIVLKIVNNAGGSGYALKVGDAEGTLAGGLMRALLPDGVLKELNKDERFHVVEKTTQDNALASLFAQRRQNKAALAAHKKVTPKTMVMREKAEPTQTYVLTRGEYSHPDKERPVSRRVPEVLGVVPEGAPANRLGLAQWFTDASNPLVSRVAVNRLWQIVFGQGIVRTEEDFGYQGEWPTHPGLMDWLAVEFRESGWDTRHMIRLMLTSSVYRQSSHARPELDERDPENRLLARYPSRRLSAEQIRDQALYISGLLREELGGPGVSPYQPDGLWREVAMGQSNTRNYKRGDGDDLYRRSLYTFWKRASPPPTMMAFDAPTRETCTIQRSVTNTPLQALALWNDVQFVEAARVLAAKVLEEANSDEERIAALVRRCTAVPPTPEATKALLAALADFRDRYTNAPGDAAALVSHGEASLPSAADKPELAAWTMLSSAVMNLYRTTTQE